MLLDRSQARNLIREAIKGEFQRLAKGGGLQAIARQIGLKDYQNLQNYANGTVPSADTFLLACLYLGWTLKIDYLEGEGSRIGQATRIEFAARQKASRGSADVRPEQLNLFEAIDQLDQNNLRITITRKLVDRLELAVGIDFLRTGS
jgi:hypothetical protein